MQCDKKNCRKVAVFYLNCHFSSCCSSSRLQQVTESVCQSPTARRTPPWGCCCCPAWGCWRTCWVRPGGPGPGAWACCRAWGGSAGGRGRGVRRRRRATASAGCAMTRGAEAGGDAVGRAGGPGGGGGGVARETGRHPPSSWR